MYFPRHPIPDGLGCVAAPDRVKDGDPVGVQQTFHMPEEFVKTGFSNMFKHADRNNPVEPAFDVTVVLQPDVDTIAEAGGFHPFAGHRVLFV